MEQSRWDWGRLGPAGQDGTSILGNIFSGGLIANAVGNASVGYTASGMGNAPHATSWMHVYGSQVGQYFQQMANSRRFGQVQTAFSRSGKFLGRATVALTIFEGIWDIGAIGYCGGESYGHF